MKKKLVVFSGAGISAESGLSTFRDNNGLWENYNISEVATPQAWAANPKLVLDFYNLRRKNAFEAQPNTAHIAIAELERHLAVTVVTQNIDDLHERAGSTDVIHLHGEVKKVRSTGTNELFDYGSKPLFLGSVCPNGFQLRPHVVWFGEEVPNLEIANKTILEADYLLITGTSLNVYPAAGLIHMTKESSIKYLVDPNSDLRKPSIKNLSLLKEKATVGVPKVANQIIKDLKVNA